MWLWRRVSKHRWSPTAAGAVDVVQAALDLRDEALSLFKVDDDVEAVQLTNIWAPTCCPNPQNISYLLLASACFTSVNKTPVLAPDPSLHPTLASKHYEVRGVDDRCSRALAKAVVSAANGSPNVRTIKEKDLKASGKALYSTDADFRRLIKTKWRQEMNV
jgi:hypothetical protein